MFRVYTGSDNDILNEVFPLKPPSNYNLRNQPVFTIRPLKIAHYGLNSLAYLGPKIWELLAKLKARYLKSAHAEFVNHTSTKWALYKFILIGFYFIYFYQLIR